MRVLLILLVIASTSFAQSDNWRPLPSQYYEYVSDTGVVMYAETQPIGKYETAYRVGIYLAAMADSARIFIPADNVDAAWIEYRMLPDTTIDSIYINIAYGSATQISTRDRVYPIDILQDSTYYWYGTLVRRCVSLSCPGFPAPYLVLLVDGSSKLGASYSGTPFLELWIYVRRRV